MDCKKVLIEYDGDIEAAAEELRKKGLAKADKKASRVAAEGKIAVASAGGRDSEDVEALMAAPVEDGSLEDARAALVSKIGENIQVRRVTARGSGDTTTGAYVHMQRIGVLVEIEGGTPELCTDVAMHVAAMSPAYATKEAPPSCA